MRRIRRKRTKYTWMPTLGGLHQVGDSQYQTSYFGGTVEADVADVGPSDLYVTPIIPDVTFFSDNTTEHASTLRDFTEGQDWALARIVGRLNLAVNQISQAGTATPAFIMVGAAFFVGRADDANEDIPDTNNAEIDPLSNKNIRQPWIWRRTWILRNLAVAPVVPGFLLTGSPDNMLRSSAVEGAVVDSKIKRRIRREERLWFVLNAYGADSPNMADAQASYLAPGEVHFNLDYRILGAMRRSDNRSTF